MVSTLVVVLVFVLDLVAFALAITAERRRNTAKIVQDASNRDYCRYDSDIATGLGVGALLLLLISQLLIMAVTRCLCCGKALRPSASRTWAIVLFITTWVFFFIAEICLLAGSVRNAYHTKYVPNSFASCQTLRKGVFGAGAAFILLTGIVSEFYYGSFSSANEAPSPYSRDSGIRMGNL